MYRPKVGEVVRFKYPSARRVWPDVKHFGNMGERWGLVLDHREDDCDNVDEVLVLISDGQTEWLRTPLVEAIPDEEG